MRILGNLGCWLWLAPWSLWRAARRVGNRGRWIRTFARQTRRLRALERYAAEKDLDAEAKERECVRMRGEAEALRAEVEGMATAHEKLLERNKEELALHRLNRIRYETGLRGEREQDEE